MALSDAMNAYKACARAEGQSLKTVRETVACVGRFAGFLGGDPNLAEIGPDDLRAFVLPLQSRQAYAQHPYTKPQRRALSPETIATYVRSIKSFFALLARDRMIPVNRLSAVKVPKTPEKLIPVLTEPEIARLLKQTGYRDDIRLHFRDSAIILTLLDTGVRISELCGLTIRDVDLDNGVLKVMGKGQKERHVPIGAKVTKALGLYQWFRPSFVATDRFWCTDDWKPLTPGRVEKMSSWLGLRLALPLDPGARGEDTAAPGTAGGAGRRPRSIPTTGGTPARCYTCEAGVTYSPCRGNWGTRPWR